MDGPRGIRIKICGITTLDDALAAVEAGADLLGFNFYPPSPRYIAPLACARLVAGLQGRGIQATTVGVFVNAAADQARVILDDCGLDLAQLSGDEPPSMLVELGQRAYKVVRLKSQDDLKAALRQYSPRTMAPAWLADAYRPGEYGGTGLTADWSLARILADQAPVLLAGGLHPENVAEALHQVHPWGVDVASGVEAAPGRKSREKLAAFGRAVRQFSEQEGAS
jgi:phosphoribosylanthranilate isomerase